MHADEVPVDADLVRRLVAQQLPAHADDRIEIVEPWGTDNAIYRLGEELVVRLPRIGWAVAQVEFEAEWLPQVAPRLTVAVPEPVFVGQPADGYPHPWAVHRWIPGRGATLEAMADPIAFARRLAAVVLELQAMPTSQGRAARNRARPVQMYEESALKAIASAADLIDVDTAQEIWKQAVEAPPHAGDVWVHADLEGNCLLADGQLGGLIDWGSACVGDPAVDVQVIWSPLFTPESRAVFLDIVEPDDAMIARAKGAAIQQACAALPYYRDTYPEIVERSRHKLEAVGVEVDLTR